MKLTPTEDLMMEVVVARTRLGEPFWHFPNTSHYARAANALEAKGLVRKDIGVQGMIRLWISEKGKDEQMSKTYTPPLLKTLRDFYTCELCGGTFYLGEHYCEGPKKGSASWKTS